ncbi:MAG: arylsulfatase [Planctomycetota bacterium]|jgi:arylsulfatase A-like enzyme
MAERPPNVLLIHVDQWRADCLGLAGHPVVETPHLDRLFTDGANFTQAYAAVPSCIASRASLMTGLTPRSHGRVGYRDRVRWDYDVTLAGLFADAGYHTQAVGKMHVSPARNLLGFHNVVLHDGYLHTERKPGADLHFVDDYLPWLRREYGPEADYIESGIACNGYVVRPWPYADTLHPSAWVTTHAVEFLRRRDPGKPFFLYASYHRPHPPLDPPEWYLDMYERKRLPPPAGGDWDGDVIHPGHGLDSPVPEDAAGRDRARRAYYAQCTFIDHQINRLIHTLHAHGATADTCICFVSDHGDLLFDHGLRAKAFPYEGSARVPLLFKFPRSSGTQTPVTVDAPVEMRDVLPTLCDVAGIAVPDSVEGKSLLPFCRGERPEWREYVHGEHCLGELSNHWLTDGRAKYAWYSQDGCEQLFDIESDPYEARDLSGERPDEVAAWRARLVSELTGREEGYVSGSELVAGRRPQATLADAGLPT